MVPASSESALRTSAPLPALLALFAVLAATSAVSAQEEADGLQSVPMERLREAMRQAPDLAQAWFRLKAGDPAGARSEAMEIVSQRPRDPDALHLLGIAAAAAGRPVQARSTLRRSTRLRPDGWVGIQLVNLYLDAGRVGPAERLVRELERAIPADVQVRRARAYLQVARGDLAGARASLLALEQAQPTADVAHQVAVVLSEEGDAAGALAATRRAVEREPGEGAYRRELFSRLAEAGAWDDLVAACAAAGADAAGGGLAAYHRGVALAHLDRNEEAVAALSQVVEHGSPDPVALVGAAGWLLQLGDYVEAERAARAAMAGREEDPSLHHLLAMVLTRQRRESEALAHYRRAADGRGDDPTFRFDLLVSLCSLGRTEELADAFERAGKDFPEDPRFQELEARCLPAPAP